MLRQLIIGKKLSAKRTELEALLVKEAELKTREAQLEEAVEEAKTDEEMAEVETLTTELETEKTQLADQKSALETTISEMEAELEELNKNEPSSQSRASAAATGRAARENERSEVNTTMTTRAKFFRGMQRHDVEAFTARDEVKEFLVRVKALMAEKRSVTVSELLIPEVMLDLLRDNMHRYSKLIARINLKPVAGKARQTIAGTVPEGVWTEAVGKLNELALSFNQIEVDGYKVGGYIPVNNSTLEDSEINLLSEIMDMLGQAIGYAVDKAIIYGTGTKMPLGIVVRLAQTSKPSSWGDNEPTWTDLHSTHIVKIDPTSKTAEVFFAELILACGKAKANYSTGSEKFWCMNSTTFASLQAKALSINAAGAIVSGQTQSMPIVGGPIDILEFIPDNDIIGGYGMLYLLAERAEASMAVSDQVKFLDDVTVFKGTARYDGRPVLGEGFMLININNTNPTTTATFATDAVNP